MKESRSSICERDASIEMMKRVDRARRCTLGADKGPRKDRSADDANPHPKNTDELDDAYSKADKP